MDQRVDLEKGRIIRCSQGDRWRFRYRRGFPLDQLTACQCRAIGQLHRRDAAGARRRHVVQGDLVPRHAIGEYQVASAFRDHECRCRDACAQLQDRRLSAGVGLVDNQQSKTGVRVDFPGRRPRRK